MNIPSSPESGHRSLHRIQQSENRTEPLLLDRCRCTHPAMHQTPSTSENNADSAPVRKSDASGSRSIHALEINVVNFNSLRVPSYAETFSRQHGVAPGCTVFRV